MKTIIDNQSSVCDAMVFFALYKYASEKDWKTQGYVSFDIADQPIVLVIRNNKNSLAIKIVDEPKDSVKAPAAAE